MLGATQNRNESFNSLIWNRCPKTEYATAATMQNAVNQAVLVFNSGRKSLLSVMEDIGIPAGPLCSSYLSSQFALRDHKLR